MPETVGLIGVGAMGSALLERLHKAGRRVQAYDISKDAIERAASVGALIVGSPAAATRGASKVHVFVRTDDEAVDVALGSGGVLSSAVPGTVLFLHSTILPKTSVHIAEAGARTGVDVLDVPITSVPSRVREGKGAMLIGGSETTFAAVHDYLKLLASNIYYFGPVGSGNTAKLAKNAINAVERIIFSEMLRLAIAGGLHPREFLNMLRAEHHGSVVTEWEKAVTLKPSGPLMRPVTNLLNKDIGQTAQLARDLGLDLPIAQLAASEGRALLETWTDEWQEAQKAG
jgi:3-hydroxyisobutyrate dehydrogenase-like beta-hydroxyacid dehydrogenase